MSTPKLTTADRLKQGHHIRLTLSDIDQPLEVVVFQTTLLPDDMVELRTGPANWVTVPRNHQVWVLAKLHPNALDYAYRSFEDYYFNT